MFETLLLDIAVILVILWAIADPNKPKPVARPPKKARKPWFKKSPPPPMPSPLPAEMTAELLPDVDEAIAPPEPNLEPIPEPGESQGCENLAQSEKKTERSRVKKVPTAPVPGEAKWPSLSAK